MLSILIFGGSGSLGHKLTTHFLSQNPDNIVYIFSRNEDKQFQMKHDYIAEFNDSRIHFIIGDVRDSIAVKNAIYHSCPHIVIIASALKHIDRCEYQTRETILTNYQGVQNILDAIIAHNQLEPDIDSVVLVSTDKACLPINTYGISKAMAEKAMVEIALRYTRFTKFMVVRYGNVINSNGSIIPLLQKLGELPDQDFTLTHDEMTRFLMTQEEAVQLIQHALDKGRPGEIIVPHLKSMRIKDLMELFAEKYDKQILDGKIRDGEKIDEVLVGWHELTRYRMVDGVFHIMPEPDLPKGAERSDGDCEYRHEFRSNIPLLEKAELKEYLVKLGLL